MDKKIERCDSCGDLLGPFTTCLYCGLSFCDDCKDTEGMDTAPVCFACQCAIDN